MSQQSNNCAIAVIGIDIGKNSFHVVGHDQRGPANGFATRTARRSTTAATTSWRAGSSISAATARIPSPASRWSCRRSVSSCAT
jgi:hypothetical protein